MSKILRFGALLCVLFFGVNSAFAAGYSCPTYKKYTSCASGYYMTSSSTSTTCNTTAAAGNACRPCSAYGSNYTCAGGTACPKVNSVTCSAGYYLKANATSCSACGGNSYYCPGGTFTPSSSDQGRNSVSSGYYSTGGTSTTRTGQTKCEVGYYCSSGVRNACSGSLQYQDTTGATSCKTVSTGYYKSSNSAQAQCDAGYRNIAATSRNECVGTFSKTGSQVNGSTPTNCYSVTSWNSCTPGTCNYTKKYSGTIVSDCTPTNCTKTANTTTGKSGYYGYTGGTGGSCSSCSSANSTYPLSDNGATNATYCYRNQTKTGSQVNGSTPSNCYSVTEWNACTPGTCTWKDYNGATDTTCTPTNCTKTAKTTTGKSGYYGYTNGTGGACSSCSSANSTYPLSDNGATNATYCYRNQTKTGTSSNASCSVSAHGSCAYNTCTPGTCTWKDYNGATDTTCTPTNCTNTVKSWTITKGYYFNGTAAVTCASGGWCPGVTVTSAPTNGTGRTACSTLGTGYTNASTGQTANTSCYLPVSAGYVRSGSSGTTTTKCSAGTYKAAHNAYYGTTYSCDNCTGRTKYSAAGAGSCSTVSSGYYTTGCNSSNNNCTGQSQCTGTTYCSSGVQYNCPSGYTANTTAGKTAASQCTISVSAGKYIATANSATQTNCTAGTYKAAHTVAYGSTSSCSSCPSGYTSTAGSASSQNSCYISVSAGHYISTAGQTSSNWATCAAGTYKAAHTVYYGSTSSCASCTGATYSGSGAGSCTTCPGSYTANTTSGKTAASQCQISVAAGKYIGTANSSSASTCAAGTYKAAHTVNYGSTSSCGVCTTDNTYSAAGAGSCSTCPSGYSNSGTTAASHANAASCKITCSGGYRVTTANGACSAITSGNVYIGSHTVAYGSTSPAATSCPTSYTISGTTAADHDAKSDCKISCAAGTQVATADAACTTPTGSWYTAQHTVSAGSTSGSNIKSCVSGYATASTTTATDHDASSDCKISCSAGTRVATANATCTTPSGNWYVGAHTVSQGSTSSVSSCLTNYAISGTAATNHDAANDCKITCAAGTYLATANATSCASVGTGYWSSSATVSQGSTSSRTQCPAGYRDGAAATAQSGCVMSVPAAEYVKTANDADSTACGTGTYKAAHTVNYGSTSTCSACPTGYDDGAAGASQSSCKITCSGGYRVTTANGACSAITSGNVYIGSHTVAYGSTSPAATSCPTSYSISGTTAADHDAKSDCKITCAAGTQVATADAACTTPTGSWYTAAHTVSAGSTSGSNVKACLTNYSTPSTTTTTDHDASTDCKISCTAGTQIASANATSCTTPSGNWYVGAHSVAQGSKSTVNSCLANYTISGTAAANHDAENDCKITCGGGTYIAAARNTTCTNVGAGYWAAASTVPQGSAGVRNACEDDMTTIGYGTGADEAGDCGRILNVGGSKIYLRSEKKTTPSLNVGINGTTYYGNMGTATKGTLRIKSGSITYSVYDESM